MPTISTPPMEAFRKVPGPVTAISISPAIIAAIVKGGLGMMINCI